MKTMSVMRLMAATAVVAMAPSGAVWAAEGAWEASYTCQVTSAERGESPRVTLLAIRVLEMGGELRSVSRFRLFNIEELTAEERVIFPDTVVDIAGFAHWTGLKATGRQEKSGYALYIPLPDIAQVVGPLEGGRVLKITVQTKEGPRTFEVDLTGSAKAIASFRVCST